MTSVGQAASGRWTATSSGDLIIITVHPGSDHDVPMTEGASPLVPIAELHRITMVGRPARYAVNCSILLAERPLLERPAAARATTVLPVTPLGDAAR